MTKKSKKKNPFLSNKEYNELKQAEKKLLELKEMMEKAKREFDAKNEKDKNLIIFQGK